MEPSQEDVKFELDEYQEVDLFSNLIDGIVLPLPQQDAAPTAISSMHPGGYDLAGNPVESYSSMSGYYEPHFLAQLNQVEGASSAPTSSFSSYPGPHNFFIQFSEAQDKTKATPWTFSQKVNKLFAGMNKAVPVHFSLSDVAPGDYQNFQVRVQVYFSQAEDATSLVHRCLSHQGPSSVIPMPPSQEAYGAIKKHFVLSDDQDAQYFEHEKGNLSLVVRLKMPAVGETHVTSFLRFMCRSSCPGGINRRPITIIFTLETLQGIVLGRSCVPLRVCSCPGRDARAEEEKAEKMVMPPTDHAAIPPEQERPSQVGPGKRKRVKQAAPKTELLDTNVAPGLLGVEDDDEVYNLQVRGRLKFEFMKSVLVNWEHVESKTKKSD